MERPEIIDGLKNAIDRGYSLEIAVSSFINAGYNQQDVLDSAKFLGGSVLSLEPKPQETRQNNQQASQQTIPQASQQPPEISPKEKTFPQNLEQAKAAQQQRQQSTNINVTIQNHPQVQKKRGWGLVIFLVILLLLLLGVLLSVIFAGDFVKELLAKIGLQF